MAHEGAAPPGAGKGHVGAWGPSPFARPVNDDQSQSITNHAVNHLTRPSITTSRTAHSPSITTSRVRAWGPSPCDALLAGTEVPIRPLPCQPLGLPPKMLFSAAFSCEKKLFSPASWLP